MCVKNSIENGNSTYLPSKLVSKLDKHFIGYKVVDDRGVSTVRNRTYKPGLHVARGVNGHHLKKDYKYNETGIASGIHVFLSYHTATINRRWNSSIVPVLCFKDDLLATDGSQAALRKVVVLAETWPLKTKVSKK